MTRIRARTHTLTCLHGAFIKAHFAGRTWLSMLVDLAAVSRRNARIANTTSDLGRGVGAGPIQTPSMPSAASLAASGCGAIVTATSAGTPNRTTNPDVAAPRWLAPAAPPLCTQSPIKATKPTAGTPRGATQPSRSHASQLQNTSQSSLPVRSHSRQESPPLRLALTTGSTRAVATDSQTHLPPRPPLSAPPTGLAVVILPYNPVTMTRSRTLLCGKIITRVAVTPRRRLPNVRTTRTNRKQALAC